MREKLGRGEEKESDLEKLSESDEAERTPTRWCLEDMIVEPRREEFAMPERERKRVGEREREIA